MSKGRSLKIRCLLLIPVVAIGVALGLSAAFPGMQYVHTGGRQEVVCTQYKLPWEHCPQLPKLERTDYDVEALLTKQRISIGCNCINAQFEYCQPAGGMPLSGWETLPGKQHKRIERILVLIVANELFREVLAGKLECQIRHWEDGPELDFDILPTQLEEKVTWILQKEGPKYGLRLVGRAKPYWKYAPATSQTIGSWAALRIEDVFSKKHSMLER